MHGMKKGTHRAGRMPKGAHMRTDETRGGLRRILADCMSGIKGTPLDESRPWGELWLVAAFAAFGIAMLAVAVAQ